MLCGITARLSLKLELSVNQNLVGKLANRSKQESP